MTGRTVRRAQASVPKPRLCITRGRVYGGVSIDLWPCAYDLSREGQALTHAYLADVARQAVAARHRRSTVSYSSGPSGCGIRGIHRDELDGVAAILKRIVCDPRYLIPLR